MSCISETESIALTMRNHRAVVDLRQFVPSDAPRVWALNNIPNVGHTADPTAPPQLPTPAAPPREFPDLADIEGSYFDAGGDFLIGEVDGHIVAMGGIRANKPYRAEVNRVRVHPAFRRQGCGRALMAAWENRARLLGFRELHLDTATNQPEAVEFYRSLGYQEVGRESRPDWTWTLVYFTKQLSLP